MLPSGGGDSEDSDDSSIYEIIEPKGASKPKVHMPSQVRVPRAKSRPRYAYWSESDDDTVKGRGRSRIRGHKGW